MSGNFRKKLLDEKLPFFVLLFSFFLSLFFLALHSFHPSATIFLEQLNNLVFVHRQNWEYLKSWYVTKNAPLWKKSKYP